MTRRFTRAPWIVALLASAFACSRDDGRTPLVVYSPHGEDILREFEKMFEAAHPDVDVRALNQPAQSCFTRIRGERENPSCDVWWGAPATTFARAADEDLLESYEPSFAAAIPEDSRDSKWRYSGQFVIPQVILYNKDRLKPEQVPTHWDDLAAPGWHGRIILRAPMDSGGMRTSFSWFITWKSGPATASFEPGFDFLSKISRNTKKLTANPQELFEAVTKDPDDVVSIWNITDAIFQRDHYHYPFGFSIPSEGVPLVIDAIALVKNPGRDAKREAAARAFYEFVNTLESSEYLAKNHGRLPVRKDFDEQKRPIDLRGLTFKALPIDRQVAASHEDEWMRRWDEQIKSLAK